MVLQIYDRAWGLARSLVIYYAWPGRLAEARRFYRRLIAPGELCFDIGAHAGSRSFVWAGLGARVVALEPQPDFARLARWLCRRRDVTVLEAAAGAAPGTIELQISRRHPTVSTLSARFRAAVDGASSFAGVRWDARLQVEMLTLDQLIARFGAPAFVKIDVEGFEEEVLRGLSRPLPALSFEYLAETAAMAEACIERVERLAAYRYNVSRGESMAFEHPAWLDAAAIRAWLRAQPPGSGSGDIYAAAPARLAATGLTAPPAGG